MCAFEIFARVFVQLYYSLGCHYFWEDDFKRAHSHFKRCARLLDGLPTCPPLVDTAPLKGFLCACAQVRSKLRVRGEDSASEEDDVEEREEKMEGVGKDSLLERLEYCRISDLEVYTCTYSV